MQEMSADAWRKWQDWFDTSIAQAQAKLDDAARHHDRLVADQAALDKAVAAGDFEAAKAVVSSYSAAVPVATPPRRSRSTASVLSSTGAALLGVAALVFTAVAWDALGVAGQAAVLGGATVAAAAASRWSQRHRLGATAESLAWLAGALAAVDVAAADRLGMIELPAHMVIACASSATALCAGALAYVTRQGTTTHSSSPSSVDEHAAAAPSPVRSPWLQLPLAFIVAVGASSYELPGGVRAAVLAVTATGVLLMSRRVPDGSRWAILAAATSVVAAGLASASVTAQWSTAVVAGSVAVLLVGRAPLVAKLLRGDADVDAGGVAQASGLLLLGAVPFQYISDTGSVSTAAMLSGVFASVAVLASLWRNPSALVTLAPLAGTVAASWSADNTAARLAGCVAAVAVTSAWLRRHPVPAAGLLGLLVPATAGIVAELYQLGAMRPLLVSVLAASLSANVATQFAAMERFATPGTVAVGGAGATAAVSLSMLSTDRGDLAAACALVCVGALGIARAAKFRTTAILVAMGFASLSYWAALPGGLAVEVATLPVAASWLVLGAWFMANSSIRSIGLLGPGLLLAAAPTSNLVLFGPDVAARTAALVVTGAVAMLAGARLRLVAPLVVGTAATLVAALSLLGPWAIGLPRWVSLGTAGLALLIAGARFESLKRSAGHARTTLAQLR